MNKKSLIAAIFSIPLVLSSTASAASLVSDDNNNTPTYETRSVGTQPSLADGSSGTITLSVYKDYPVGSGYPSSIYHEHWHTYSEKWISGTMYVSDIYLLNNGYVRVWYRGALS